MSVRYWHGGMPGLRVGDLIEPGHERATRDDCPICDARRVGTSLAAGNAIIDAPSAHRDRVYITTDRLYAKHYASLYGRGDLYRVEPIGDLLRSTEDSYETYAVTAARVVSVYDRAVLLTWSERRRLYREWGQADLDHAAAQRVSGVSGGADERLSEYTGTTTKAAPAGASTPGVRGPDPYEGGALTQDSRVSSSVVLDG